MHLVTHQTHQSEEMRGMRVGRCGKEVRKHRYICCTEYLAAKIHRFSSTLVSACISINVCAVKSLTDKAFSVHRPLRWKSFLLPDTHTTQHHPLLVIKRQTFGYLTFDCTYCLKLIASGRTKISGLGVVRVNSISSLC